MTQPIAHTAPYPEQLARTKTYMDKMSKSQPEAMKGFSTLHRAASAPGVLDTKTKELIALAIGVAARCDGCIAFHTHDALDAGANEAEIMEVLGVALLMGGGPSLIYATHAMEAMEQFKEAKK